MSFLTETEAAKYKVDKAAMLKQKKVVSIEDLVTPEGRLSLDLAQVDKISPVIQLLLFTKREILVSL